PLTLEGQQPGPQHVYTLLPPVVHSGAAQRYEATMSRSAELHGALLEHFGAVQAAYGVCLAYRLRYAMQFNAREAMHMLELRTTAQGHPEYRKVCQQMHVLIAEKAGHRALAELMSFVDHADYERSGLERLAGERRAEQRRRDIPSIGQR
ncbi:MAG: FAD-dependent thymidylate synthase, partial [Acidimicrobiales bacterium]